MILITGATAGIGEATARAFAETGRDLVLLARRKDRLERLAEELTSKSGVEIRTFVLDVGSAPEHAKFFEENARLLERVSVLINNAGLAKGFAPFQETESSQWDAMIDTNIKGLLAMTRAVLPLMIRKREGHIVNLGSVAGHHSYPRGNVYCATKSAVHALSECLRLDLNGTGIRVTEISPGLVETDFSLVRLEDAGKAKAVYAGMTPLTARDVAETILWCVSRPAHVNIQEVILYPTDQASPTVVSRRSQEAF